MVRRALDPADAAQARRVRYVSTEKQLRAAILNAATSAVPNWLIVVVDRIRLSRTAVLPEQAQGLVVTGVGRTPIIATGLAAAFELRGPRQSVRDLYIVGGTTAVVVGAAVEGLSLRDLVLSGVTNLVTGTITRSVIVDNALDGANIITSGGSGGNILSANIQPGTKTLHASDRDNDEPEGGTTIDGAAVDDPPASPHAKDDEFDGSTGNTYTWVNQVGATFSEDDGVGTLEVADGSAGAISARCRVITPPAEPWTLTWKFYLHALAQNFTFGGIIARCTSSGRCNTFGRDHRASGLFSGAVLRLNSVTSHNADIAFEAGTGPYYRLDNDGTNLDFWGSIDCRHWTRIFTGTLASWLTGAGGTCDQVGIYLCNMRASGAATAGQAHFHWMRWNWTPP